MARRKKASSGEGLLTIFAFGIICFVYQYWQYALGLGVAGAIIYFLVKKTSSSKQSPIYETKKHVLTNEFDLHAIELRLAQAKSQQIPRFIAEVQDETTLRFIKNKEEIKIGRHSFLAELLYVGESRKHLPHLVRPSLELGDATEDLSADMGYWPSYQRISDNNRATYIEWLRRGRNDESADIGLVFLYFYGLEYRAIVEKTDTLEILSEIVRLFQIYASKSRSFKGYANNFICLLIAINPELRKSGQAILAPIQDKLSFPKQIPNLQDSIEIDYTSFASDYYQSKVKDLGSEFQAIEKELKALFLARASHVVNSPKQLVETKDTWTYKSATPLDLSMNIDIPKHQPSKECLHEYSNIWSSCLADLRIFADRNHIGDPFAVLNLPEEIRTGSRARQFKKMNDFLKDSLEVPIDISVLTNLLQIELPAKPTLSFSKKLSSNLGKAGLAIEPDPETSSRSYKQDDVVVVFQKPEGRQIVDRFKKATHLINTLAAIASNQTNLDSNIATLLSSSVAKKLKLSPNESIRLNHISKITTKRLPTTSAAAKKLAQNISANESKQFAAFMVSLLTENNLNSIDKIRELATALKAIGLNKDSIKELIPENAASPIVSPVIQKADRRKSKGSLIPQEQGQRTSLDAEAIEAAIAQTTKVSSILDSVFKEVDDALPSQTIDVSHPTDSSKKLSTKESALYDFLRGKSSWPISEVEDKCRIVGVMYGSAVEGINQWSEQEFGESLLEEDNDILIVHLEILSAEAQIA